LSVDSNSSFADFLLTFLKKSVEIYKVFCKYSNFGTGNYPLATQKIGVESNLLKDALQN
jgi:hypothetical protein